MALLRLMNFDRSTVLSDFRSDYAVLNIPDPRYGGIGTNGSFGSNYLTISDQGSCALQTHAPIPGGTLGILGVRLKNNGYSDCYFGVCDPAGLVHLVVIVTISGQIFLSQGSSTQMYESYGHAYGARLYAGTIGQVTQGTLNYFQLKYTISPTAGTATLLLNGAVLCALTFVNTRNTSSSDSTTVAYALGGYGSFQDIYVADGTGPAPNNNFLGDVRVYLAKPTGNGTLTQFTPVGAATNWQVAATSPMVPATIYNTANTVGSTDLYTAAPLPPAITTILGVQVEAQLIKSDAGPRTAALQIKSGAAVAAGASHPLSVSVANYTDIFVLDPLTSAAFTVAGVNALQFGPTIVS